MFASSVPAPFLEYLKETYAELTPELASTIVRREELIYGKNWGEIFGKWQMKYSSAIIRQSL